MRSAFALVALILIAPNAHAGHKPKAKQFFPPTQNDITVNGCVTVSGITYKPFAIWRREQGVYGIITNGCGKSVTVNLYISFYGGGGYQLDLGMSTRLVTVGQSVSFRIEPSGNEAFIQTGLVTSVFAQPIP